MNRKIKHILGFFILMLSLAGVGQNTLSLQSGVIVGGYKDTPAEFPGGMDALYKYMNVKLKQKIFLVEDEIAAVRPALAKFTVNPDGKVDSVKIVETSNIPRVDNLFINALKKMPRWKPAKSRNKPIAQEFSFPLIIELEQTKTGP